MSLSDIIRAWRKFFFEPSSAFTIAVYRILFGLLVLQSALIHVGPSFLDWYGPGAIIPLESVKSYFWHNQARLDALLLFPQENSWLCFYFATFILAAFFATIGFATRLSLFWVSLGLISLHHHCPFNINGGDSFLRLVSIFLVFSPCGYALSVDNLIRRRLGIPIAETHLPWAQRMIQIQLALVYCATFWYKFSGVQWLDGTAVYYATRLEDLVRLDIPFIFDNIWFCRALSWYTLLIEFAMWTLVWVKEFRYPVLIGAVILHLGIDSAINLPVFEWAFIATLLTFVPSSDLSAFFSKRRNNKGKCPDIGLVAK